jgi:hypothetical protein
VNATPTVQDEHVDAFVELVGHQFLAFVPAQFRQETQIVHEHLRQGGDERQHPYRDQDGAAPQIRTSGRLQFQYEQWPTDRQITFDADTNEGERVDGDAQTLARRQRRWSDAFGKVSGDAAPTNDVVWTRSRHVLRIVARG